MNTTPPSHETCIVALKTRYDPHNLFSRNQNIRPVAGA
nr:BBE domain-containing protein [Paraburkholderia tagetis]